MIFTPPLIKARLIKRYKRFCVRAEAYGTTVARGDHKSGREQDEDAAKTPRHVIEGYCPNTGSMKSCAEPGWTIYFCQESKQHRKRPLTWELSKTPSGGFIGIHTHRANALVAEALEREVIPELAEWGSFCSEVCPYDKGTRLDFFLSHQSPVGDDTGKKPSSLRGKPGSCGAFVEVKNVTLYEPDRDGVFFPDAVSQRGLKHLQVLTRLAEEGRKAYILFVVNRSEGAYFAPAHHIHPDYAKALGEAHHKGVEILAYRTEISTEEISLSAQSVPVRLEG